MAVEHRRGRRNRLRRCDRVLRDFIPGDVEGHVVEGGITHHAFDDPDLAGLVLVPFDAADKWLEEDEVMLGHARDPFARLDVRQSSRHVRVEKHGELLAESNRPVLLFETGLPVRYYLPKTDVRLDLLVATDTVTHCPYKGQARYWSVRAGDTLHKDIAWSYPTPLPESQKIAGLISFYNEKVDLYVDRVLEPRPQTKFSS